MGSPNSPWPVARPDLLRDALSAVGADGVPEPADEADLGAVGQVVGVRTRDGARLVVKRFAPDHVDRAEVEAAALRVTARAGLAVPTLLAGPVPLADGSAAVVMTRLGGTRLDHLEPRLRRTGLPALGAFLRRVHDLAPPAGLPERDVREVAERYAAAGGPAADGVLEAADALEPGPGVLGHGDLTSGNALGRVVGDAVVLSGVVDWERACVVDAVSDLARAVVGAGFKDAGGDELLRAGYGTVDERALARWAVLHTADLWLWFDETGHPHRDRVGARVLERTSSASGETP